MDIKEIKIMIEEQYVSFETAKLAKEKGFVPNVERLSGSAYDVNGYLYVGYYIPVPIDVLCYAPTQSTLGKWLREEYDIHVLPLFWETKGDHYCDYTYDIKRPMEDVTEKTLWFDRYEEAMEAGLKEALKLI